MKLAELYTHVGPYLEGRASFVDTQHALFGRSSPADAQRLHIYQRFCAQHRNTATGGVHQVLREVITAQGGESLWNEVVMAYFQEHPMHHVEINENGAHLAAFLSRQTQYPPFWAGLADFEWWEWQTAIAPDEPAPAGSLRLSATVELRPYAYNFVDWLAESPRAETPPRQDVTVLFWRNRSLDARRALVTRDELAVLKAVFEGQPVERSETFQDLLAAGIVVGE
jgi:hypothetical protein